MRGAALAALGVVLAALLVWWLAADERRAAPHAPAAPETERRKPAPAPAELTVAAAPREQVREPSVPDAPLAATSEAATEPVAEPLAAVPLSGTIVVVDEQGLEHPAEDGSFAFVLWSGDTGAWQEVAVAGGRWSARLTPEEPLDALGLEDVRLGDRTAAPQPEWAEQFPVPESGTLALRVRWPPRSVLHVRDLASGRELAPVLLVEVNGWPESRLGHPGRAAEEARDLGPSPVDLPSSAHGMGGTRTLFARSPGYAWGRIEIDEKTGGERVLELEPAGALEVRWTGASADPGARLRIFGASYHPVFEAELAGSSVLAEDLAPGSYAVKAQIGDFWHEPLVLAETAAEVVAGRRTLASLNLAEVTAPAHVPLAGTLVVPREWELGHFELGLTLLDTALAGFDGRLSISRDTMQATGEPATVFAWSAGDVQPGRYEAELDEPGFSVVLVVGPAGLVDARIEVPPPAEVRVRCVEVSTGLPAEGASVTWRCRLPEGVRSWSSRQATQAEEPGVWRSRMPLGPVLLSCSGGGFGWKSTEVVVAPGFNEFVLELERLASLAVAHAGAHPARSGEPRPLLDTHGQWRTHAPHARGRTLHAHRPPHPRLRARAGRGGRARAGRDARVRGRARASALMKLGGRSAIFLRSMDLGDLPELTSGFVTLLLLPTLGVVGLLNKRAIPVLFWTMVAWTLVGGLALYTHHTLAWNQRRFLRGWMIGIGLGAAFLLVARLHADKRVKPWIRSGLALLTVIVFVRSLFEFVQRYA